MSWVAIDFETATRERASACAMGIAVVERGEIVDTRSWLIQPPGNVYEPWNTAIHGMGSADTADCPPFADRWLDAQDFVAGRLLTAHNAGFDMGVIRAAARAAGLEPKPTHYGCTMVFSRRQWRGLPSYSLPLLCDHLDIDLLDHHDPCADAIACAEVALRLLAETGAPSLEEAAAQIKVRFGQLGPDDIRCIALTSNGRRLQPANPNADPDHPFFGACIAFTGALEQWTREDAAVLAAEQGAHCVSTVSRKTDYLVVGVQDARKLRADGLSGKMRKAAELAEAGVEIEILTEDDFERLL